MSSLQEHCDAAKYFGFPDLLDYVNDSHDTVMVAINEGDHHILEMIEILRENNLYYAYYNAEEIREKFQELMTNEYST